MSTILADSECRSHTTTMRGRLRQEIVDRASARLKRQGVPAATHVCPGEPAEVLITIAGADMRR